MTIPLLPQRSDSLWDLLNMPSIGWAPRPDALGGRG